MSYTTALQRLRHAGAHSFAAKLAGALTSTRKQGRDETRGYAETALLSALAEDGCPVCRTSAGHDDRYFFSFLHENYAQIEVIERLIRSLGFCLAHGSSLLTRIDEAASQLAVVHEAIARHLILLTGTGKGRQSWINSMSSSENAVARCPTCRSAEEAVRRSAFFLAGMLEDPDVTSRYANPGILCLPHLQMVVREVGDTRFERLLRQHADALSSALDAGDGTRREPSDRIDPLVQRLLHLAVGRDTGSGPYRPTASQGAASAIEPAGRAGANIWKLEACPVCLEMRRAWFEWVDWLDTAGRGDNVEDVLPLCPDHVWASAHLGGAALAVATARAAAKAALWQIQPALWQIDDSDASLRRGPLAWPLGGGSRIQMRVGRARAIFSRPISCPVCRRLESARDRTLLLLFALLEEGTQRTAFEAGYGLCLKHFPCALSLRPKPTVAEFIADVQLAKLSRLEWELTEYLRKQAWSARPEKKDEEQRAPARAVHRFSGCARPPADDPWMRVEYARSLDSATAAQVAAADRCSIPLLGGVQPSADSAPRDNGAQW
jgi:hypothetical protein